MKQKKDKFLPVGTVVLLKGATKRLMITGFLGVEKSNIDKIWDYSGCIYPEGFLSSNQTCLFDHNQIEEICHLGLEDDDEEREFKNKLKKLATNNNIFE